MQLPETVELVEVGPRDGLQSLARVFPTATKARMVRILAAAGLQRIELTAFVRKDTVPQLADAEQLVEELGASSSCRYRALVPNRQGALRAVSAGLNEIVALVTASETYAQMNQGMTTAENLRALEQVIAVASARSCHVVVGIAMAMFCPYEGRIPPERILRLIGDAVAQGIDEVYIATSAGVDAPREVFNLASAILAHYPELRLGVHLHNTNGMALANALAAIQAGVRILEGSICGLGGGIRLPSESGNHGNVATEDLVHMFREMDVATGVDFDELTRAGATISDLLGVPSSSYVAAGGTRELAQHAANVSMHPAATGGDPVA